MSVLETGAAGFIGSHVRRLIDRGEDVAGIDSMNDYYDPTLKQAWFEQLLPRSGFRFRQADIAERRTFDALKADLHSADRPSGRLGGRPSFYRQSRRLHPFQCRRPS